MQLTLGLLQIAGLQRPFKPVLQTPGVADKGRHGALQQGRIAPHARQRRVAIDACRPTDGSRHGQGWRRSWQVGCACRFPASVLKQRLHQAVDVKGLAHMVVHSSGQTFVSVRAHGIGSHRDHRQLGPARVSAQ